MDTAAEGARVPDTQPYKVIEIGPVQHHTTFRRLKDRATGRTAGYRVACDPCVNTAAGAFTQDFGSEAEARLVYDTHAAS